MATLHRQSTRVAPGTPAACPTHRLCDQHSHWWRPPAWEPLHEGSKSLCCTSGRGTSLSWQVRSVRWSQSVSLHCRSVQGEAGSDSPAVHQGCSSVHKALLRAQPCPSCSAFAHQELMSIYRSGGTALGPGCPMMTAGDEGHGECGLAGLQAGGRPVHGVRPNLLHPPRHHLGRLCFTSPWC